MAHPIGVTEMSGSEERQREEKPLLFAKRYFTKTGDGKKKSKTSDWWHLSKPASKDLITKA
jgi:hypothetical protein